MVDLREFEQLLQRIDRQILRRMPVASQITMLWLARFPHGQISAPSWPPQPSDMPALWLPPQAAEARSPLLVVMGALTDGGLSCLDDEGVPVMLTPQAASRGRLLSMKFTTPSYGPDSSLPASPNGFWQRMSYRLSRRFDIR